MATTNPVPPVAAASDPFAIEWAATAGADTAGGANPGHDTATPRRPGDPMAVLGTREVTYERLPMLEVVVERLQHLLTVSMREFTAGEVGITLESIGAQRFGDWVGRLPLPTMLPVFKAIDWAGDGLVRLDNRLIYSVIEVLLGSRRRTAPARVESRPFTTIEATLIERLTRLILVDLGQSFAPVTPARFRLERTETDPRLATITRPGNACVVVTMRVDLGDRGGTLEIVLPYATLEPARDVLMTAFMGEKLGADSVWQSHLAEEVWQAEIELQAILEERAGTLAEVLGLQVGSVLRLDAGAETPVVLRCGQVPMLVGQVGRRGDTIVIKVEDRIQRHEGGLRS